MTSIMSEMDPRNGDWMNSRALAQQRVAQNSKIDTGLLSQWKNLLTVESYDFPYGKDMQDGHLGVQQDEVVVKVRHSDPIFLDQATKALQPKSIYSKEKDLTIDDKLLPLISSLNGLPLPKGSLKGLSVAEQTYLINSKFSTVGVAGTKCDFEENVKKLGRTDFAAEIGGVRSGVLRGPKPIRAGELIVWTAPPPVTTDEHGKDMRAPRVVHQENKRAKQQVRDGTEGGKAMFYMEPYDPMNIVSPETLEEVFLKPLEAAIRANNTPDIPAANFNLVDINGAWAGSVDAKAFLSKCWPMPTRDPKIFIVHTLVQDMILFVLHCTAVERVRVGGGDEHVYAATLDGLLRTNLRQTLIDLKSIFSVPSEYVNALPVHLGGMKAHVKNIIPRILNDQAKINHEYERRTMGFALSDAQPGQLLDYRLGGYLCS
jgi:hypothetical protein